MSQSTLDLVLTAGGDDVASALTKLQANQSAAWSLQSGSTAPTSPPTYLLWLDTSSAAKPIKINIGTPSVPNWVVLFPNITVAAGALLNPASGTLTADLAAGGFNITGLGAAADAGDAVRKDQVDGRVHVANIPIRGFNASTSQYLFLAPPSCTIVKACWVTSEFVTASGGARYDLNIINLGTDGTGTDELCSADFSSSGGDWFPDMAYDMAVDQNTALNEGELLRLDVVKTGSPESLAAADLLLALYYQVAI